MFRTFEYFWYFIGVSEAAMIPSSCDDVPTEDETRNQCRRRSVVVTRRLVPLVGSAPVRLASRNHKRSQDLLEQAFGNGM